MFVFCNSKSFFFLVTFLAKTQLLRHLHWVRVTCSLQCVFNELPRCSSNAILWAVWLNTRRAGQATIWARRRQARQGLEVAKRTSRSQEVNNAQISKETTTLTTPTARRDPKTKKKKKTNKRTWYMYVCMDMYARVEKAMRRANNFRPSDNCDGENAWKMCKWHRAIYNNCWPRRGQTAQRSPTLYPSPDALKCTWT